MTTPLNIASVAGLVALLAVGPASADPGETVIHSFRGPPGADVAIGGLVGDASGALYGVSIYGGSRNLGEAFELLPPGDGRVHWSKVTLHSFAGPAAGDGSYPSNPLIIDGSGNLYGATGTEHHRKGSIVFELRPPGPGQSHWQEIVLHRFKAKTDGEWPEGGLLLDSSGALYGTTNIGGTSGHGTVFRLTPPSAGRHLWTETILHNFSEDGGGLAPGSSGLIVDSGGNLYGTAGAGGASNDGVVFELSPPTGGAGSWVETVLHSFAGGADGLSPYSGVVADAAGNLYGTTYYGGTPSVAFGCGTVFQLRPPAQGATEWTESVIHAFSDGLGCIGSAPLTVAGQSTLYGSTPDTDINYYGGVAFRLDPPEGGQDAWNFTALHVFGTGQDGIGPQGPPILGLDGALYGLTYGGGTVGLGTIYRISQ